MRCFFGINLDSYRSAFERIDLPKRDDMRRVREHHITLAFFRDLSERDAAAFEQRLREFSFPGFEIVADRILAFPDQNSPELYALGFRDAHSRTLCELRNGVLHTIKREHDTYFNPHVTLIRKELLTSNFKKTFSEYARIRPFSIHVNSFGLYTSDRDKGMNTYEQLFNVELS